MGHVELDGALYRPFLVEVVWALKQEGIEYDFIEEDLSSKSTQLLQYNPVYEKNPVLVDSGKPVCEQMIVVEYIDEIWPNNPLLPADPYETALVRFWVRFI